MIKLEFYLIPAILSVFIISACGNSPDITDASTEASEDSGNDESGTDDTTTESLFPLAKIPEISFELTPTSAFLLDSGVNGIVDDEIVENQDSANWITNLLAYYADGRLKSALSIMNLETCRAPAESSKYPGLIFLQPVKFIFFSHIKWP